MEKILVIDAYNISMINNPVDYYAINDDGNTEFEYSVNFETDDNFIYECINDKSETDNLLRIKLPRIAKIFLSNDIYEEDSEQFWATKESSIRIDNKIKSLTFRAFSSKAELLKYLNRK